jgi:hypothetical protein
MAMPTSGAISLSQFRTTFGGTAPDSVSEYYRGGSHVADNAINTAIPQSGAASFSDYYGGAGTQTRNISVNMDYNLGFSAFGLTDTQYASNPIGTPGSFSVGANSLAYQPVFKAGTGFITSASITIQQNEDTGSQSGYVILYGGTSYSTATNIVAQWNAGSSGSTGGSRSYSLVWGADGKISSLTYTGGGHNVGIITLVTDNVSAANAAGYTWFGFRLKNPPSFSGKVGEVMTGTFFSTSITQPS